MNPQGNYLLRKCGQILKLPADHHWNESRLMHLGLGLLYYRGYHNEARTHRRIGVVNDAADQQFQLDCETLQVPENCDENQVRSAFIKLAKKYHPDGRGSESNAAKFNQVDAAYKNMLRVFADQRHNLHKVEGEYGLYYDAKRKGREEKEKKEEENEQDIKHTAPQHRQYLSYDGLGFGSPAKREKQYQKIRAAKAASNVHEHRIQKALNETPCEETAVVKDTRAAKKIMTSFGMDRLVEDMIQESVARGEFDNLPGQGKPLKHDSSYNPYVDFTTHKLNQVLIDNGFTPEWILLEKEIRQEIRDIRDVLLKRRHKYEETLTDQDLQEWQKFVQELKPTCDQLNAKIQKYNLVVPTIHKQLICLQLEREARKALEKFSPDTRTAYISYDKTLQLQKQNIPAAALDSNSDNLLSFLFSILSSKK